MISKSKNENHASNAKGQYVRPQLTVYGSIRNLTGGSTGGGNDGSATMSKMSDPRTKENITQIGAHAAGFGIYLFDYKTQFRDEHGHGRQFGVMADEVAQIAPDAVSIESDGYAKVDYAKIGIVHH